MASELRRTTILGRRLELGRGQTTVRRMGMGMSMGMRKKREPTLAPFYPCPLPPCPVLSCPVLSPVSCPVPCSVCAHRARASSFSAVQETHPSVGSSFPESARPGKGGRGGPHLLRRLIMWALFGGERGVWVGWPFGNLGKS